MANSGKKLMDGGGVAFQTLPRAAGDDNADDDYVRPPPRPLVSTVHDKPATHPQQVHISVVGANRMRICWVTDDDDGRSSPPSVVEYGTSPGEYTASATGDHATYSYSDYKSGAIHHVTIGPLEPATTRSGRRRRLSHIGEKDYDVALVAGDLSYADGKQPLWDSFGRLVQPLASARPWMVTEGNHEKEKTPPPPPVAGAGAGVRLSPSRFAAYNARWRMPREESGSPSSLYYSFDAAGGAAHVVMLGSRRTPWVVAVAHGPWYSTNGAHQGEGERMRRAMEPLLYDARVDVVFSAHVHAYERFTRIYDNEANSQGPMYITIGDGGNVDGHSDKFIEDHELAHLSEFREMSFGHGRLRIVSETKAIWTWHRNDDQHATVRDVVVLESMAGAKTN
ncbi:hypothetical protein OsJ_35237 [Oryza sativa Japonica Group]|uniref:Purple acid phosphatase n=1 Tax=Oryza sativa subsp. japonica TaxID=39947 RepID=B9GBX0_ORYSJ|nr:hypothetical protein OsJ_35237 [Oryza sativa Japonica Group]